jgi:hypothetical protein
MVSRLRRPSRRMMLLAGARTRELATSGQQYVSPHAGQTRQEAGRLPGFSFLHRQWTTSGQVEPTLSTEKAGTHRLLTGISPATRRIVPILSTELSTGCVDGA